MALSPLSRRIPIKAQRFGGSPALSAAIAAVPVRRTRQYGAPGLIGDEAASTPPSQPAGQGYSTYEAYYGDQVYHYLLNAQGLGAAAAAAASGKSSGEDTDSRYPSPGYLMYEAYYGQQPYHYIAAAQGLGQSIAADVLSAVPGGQDALNYVKQKIVDFMALGGSIDNLRSQASSTSTAISNAGGDTTEISGVIADAQSLRDDYDSVMSQVESIMDVLKQEGILGQLITVAVLTTIVAIAGAMAYVYSKYSTVQQALAAVQAKTLTPAQAANIINNPNSPNPLTQITGTIGTVGVVILAFLAWQMFGKRA